MSAKLLSEKPSRTDFTDRECSRIIGGVIGAIAGQAESLESLRNAVKFWAENDYLWEVLRENEKNNAQVGLLAFPPW
jgi:hypothetical protein